MKVRRSPFVIFFKIPLNFARTSKIYQQVRENIATWLSFKLSVQAL